MFLNFILLYRNHSLHRSYLHTPASRSVIGRQPSRLSWRAEATPAKANRDETKKRLTSTGGTPVFRSLGVLAFALMAITQTELLARDRPVDQSSDHPWPKATRAEGAARISIPANFKNASRSAVVTRNDTKEIVATNSAPPSAPWWTIFRDLALDRLEKDALASNQDLQQALARVTEAREQARASAADFFPHLNAPLRASRQRTTNTGPISRSRIIGSGFFPTTGAADVPSSFAGQALSTTYNDFQAPLSLSYELDVFGRIRHNYGQARASAQANEADRRAVELSLTAEVATDYFALRALDAEAGVLRRTFRLRSDAVQLQHQRLEAGTASKLDLSRAEVELANTEADLTDVMRERAELENTLAALCGEVASDFKVSPRPLGESAPPEIPATIPAALLTQRPDLVEAERRLAAASEGIRVARAELLPTFNIQGNYGYESAQFNQLFENQSHVWSAVAAVNVPIFEGGRNIANLKAARARRDEAFAAYQQTALTAFKETENALVDLRARAQQASARERAVASANNVLDGSQQRYLEGAVNYFEVIDAQRLLLGAELASIQTLNARYAATVSLVHALGGAF